MPQVSKYRTGRERESQRRMMKVLVFGATGQVATALQRMAGDDLAVESLDRSAVDLAEPASCAAPIAHTKADVVINAAAYTAVDRAEDDDERAFAVNAEAPGVMARAAAARGLPLLHVSTDYVFDGLGHAAWTEDAAPAPRSVYGRSKLAGEQAVAAAGGPHATLRTSWVFSADGANFVRTMLRLGAERDSLSVVDDQRGGPTAAADIAGALIAVARAFRAGRGRSGVFHYAGAPAVSWCGFAEEIFRRTNRARRPAITPIASAAWPSRAERPMNSVLDCKRIAAAYGITQPDWRLALEEVLVRLGEKDKAAS